MEKMNHLHFPKGTEDFYALISGSVWLRLVLGLKVTRLLGPIVNILGKMLRDVIVFLVLFILVLLVFTCMA